MTRPVLWEPDAARVAGSSMARFEAWLAREQALTFQNYEEMWAWSTTDLEGFWSAIWAFFDLPASKKPSQILAKDQMPGAVWGPGSALNYIDHILRHADTRPDAIALRAQSETFGDATFTWAELHTAVGSVAAALRDMGIQQGDRVVAILPNTPAALIAFLATASLGAVWSICAPDMGHVAILDRFKQIEPKVLIAQDAYRHAGKIIDRKDVIEGIAAGLPSLNHKVVVPARDMMAEEITRTTASDWHLWDSMLDAPQSVESRQVPFNHPLWIVYSSGTTGNPKPIVHGHGGIILEAGKQSLHMDIGPEDRFCWFTSSGWIMWNAQWMALGQGAQVALFDGAPNYPDMQVLWRFVADERLTYFGAGAAFFAGCLKAGITPRESTDLSALRSIGSTGSPLSEDAYRWIYEAVKPDVWLAPISGGTDFAGAFVLGHPGLPVRSGEMQVRALGNAVQAFDPDGAPLIGAVGELVCTRPLPSMPLYFWGDTDGRRLHDAYFDTYPGIWRHGDWIEISEHGGAVIYGRSDATINRKGLRMGSSEIYSAVEALDQIVDSLVVDLEYLGRESFMPLFVVLRDGTLDDALKHSINKAIEQAVSPRFIPNEIIQISEVPRTLSGKKLEVPVKKLLLGGDPVRVVNRSSMANPDSFDFFVAYAENRG